MVSRLSLGGEEAYARYDRCIEEYVFLLVTRKILFPTNITPKSIIHDAAAPAN